MRSTTILFLVAWAVLTVTWATAGEISVSNPWIREAPPGAEMLAAYMTINNNSGKLVQLDSVACAAFAMVEIHRTEMQNGVSHMMRQSDLQIKDGENIVLEPGGYHLMLMQTRRHLQAGDTVELELHFTNGETIPVTADVRKQ